MRNPCDRTGRIAPAATFEGKIRSQQGINRWAQLISRTTATANNSKICMEAEELRLRLIEALNKREIDYGKVLSLSAALVQHDKEHVRFSVDAGLISRLGEELVARQETAVSEIVKNAYDADATEVTLTFSRTDQPGGRLIVKDNGNGMNREQLVSGFMRLASPDKTLEPKSPMYCRTK